MKKLLYAVIAILLATAASAQRHTPIEIKQLAFRKLPNGQKPLGLDLDKYITSYLATNGGGGGTVPDTVLAAAIYEEISYTDLSAKIADSTLTVGKRYLISDFKTTFTLNISGDPYTSANVEPIVVTALTTSSLEPIAYSISHPKDILYYDVDGSTYMPGSTTGCIYRRIDTEKNISVPFDFREFKVEYKNIDDAEAYDVGGTYNRGKIVKDAGNYYISKISSNLGHGLGDQQYWLPFGSNLNTFSGEFDFIHLDGAISFVGSASSPNLCFTITGSSNFIIESQPLQVSETLFFINGTVVDCTLEKIDKCYFNSGLINNNCGYLKNVISQGNFFSGNIMGDVQNIVVNGDFANNIIKNGFNYNFITTASGNTIESDATGNIIGENFRDNTIGLRFQNNTIGTNFGGQADNYGNQIGNDFHDNVIGNYFSGNVIGNWFYANTVGNDCQENNLPFKFYSNTTGDSFQNWNGQHYLNGVDFTLLTLPVSGATKYIFYDPTYFNSWGYYGNGVFRITAF